MDWSQEDLAKNAGVGLGTIQRLEKTNGKVVCTTATLDAVSSALATAGIRFLNDSEPGVRLTAVEK